MSSALVLVCRTSRLILSLPQRALEIHCDELLVAKNGVDGVYDDDPNKNPDARRFDALTYSEALRRDLKVIDGSALALCRENGLTTRIFGMGEDGLLPAR